MNYVLTRENVAHQLAAIRSRVQALTIGLDEAALNWQPAGGRQWSIAQCLHHLALTTEFYSQALDVAIDAAPQVTLDAPARPNLLGRVLIWAIEPPVRIGVSARAELMPPSRHVPDVLLRQYDASLDRLAALVERTLRIDAGRTRYANPLAGGVKSFNVVTGVMVMLAHNRRHLVQAERVRTLRSPM